MKDYFDKCSLKVRLTDVDIAGFVHHSNFFVFLEEARLALLDSAGYSYSDLEKMGVAIVVTNVNGSYNVPVTLGENITIFSKVSKVKNFSLKLEYEIINEKGLCVFTGETTHAFINVESKELTEIPAELLELFNRAKEQK